MEWAADYGDYSSSIHWLRCILTVFWMSDLVVLALQVLHCISILLELNPIKMCRFRCRVGEEKVHQHKFIMHPRYPILSEQWIEEHRRKSFHQDHDTIWVSLISLCNYGDYQLAFSPSCPRVRGWFILDATTSGITSPDISLPKLQVRTFVVGGFIVDVQGRKSFAKCWLEKGLI